MRVSLKTEYDKMHMSLKRDTYGAASTSRLLKMIGLVCKKALQKRRYSAKETFNFKELTKALEPKRLDSLESYGVALVSKDR